MKKILKGILSSLIVAHYVTICSSCKSGTFVCDKEIANHNPNGWYTSIKEIAQSECPTIYLTADAAYYIIQASIMYYTSTELSRQIGNSNPFADQIMLISYKNYQYKKGENSGSTSMFKYSYENLLGDANGQRSEYKDILKYGVEAGDHAVITNYEDFDISADDYSSQADTDANRYWLYTYDTTVKILNNIYSMYTEFDPNIKFNFVIIDILLNSFIKDSHNSINLQRTIYEKANKIYWLSDGSFSYAKEGWRGIYKTQFEKYGYKDAKTQDGIWNFIHSSLNNQVSKNKLILNNPIAFLNNEKYCIFLGNDGDWYRTINGRNNLCPSTMTKYAYSDINWTSYKSKLNFQDEVFNSLNYSIISFFDKKNSNEFIKNEDNFISLYATEDTKNHFNPNNKTILVPTDQYLMSKDDTRDKNILDILNEMFKHFNPSNYNLVLKSHPRIDETKYEERMHELFGDYYENVVILKPKYPLELLILLDWQNANKSGVDHYYLYDPNSFITDSPSGFLGGWSLNTTSIISLINLIANFEIYNGVYIGNAHSLKLLNLKSLYLPKNFHISDGIVDNNSKTFNYLLLQGLYTPFFTIGKFIDINFFNFV